MRIQTYKVIQSRAFGLGVSGKTMRQVILYHNVGFNCRGFDDAVSNKDLHFSRGFQIFGGSQSCTPLPASHMH